MLGIVVWTATSIKKCMKVVACSRHRRRYITTGERIRMLHLKDWMLLMAGIETNRESESDYFCNVFAQCFLLHGKQDLRHVSRLGRSSASCLSRNRKTNSAIVNIKAQTLFRTLLKRSHLPNTRALHTTICWPVQAI